MTAPWRTIVIDDAPDVREIVRAVLGEDAGLRVVGEAPDGTSGIALARRVRPDLVLLDVAMPVMDGLEVLAVLRAELPSTVVVMLSGFVADAAAARALAEGAVGYLEKRDMVNSLVSRLHTVLNGIQAR